MLSAERRLLIRQKIEQEGIVKISDLAEEFGVSTMTVRRDLDQLEQEMNILRTHGGAMLKQERLREFPYREKEGRNESAKAAIAREAAKWVRPGESVILDAGSTNLKLARHLKGMDDLLLVTNDLKIALELGDEDGLRVLLTGGQLKPKVYSLEGFHGETMLAGLHVDTAFIGCDAFDFKYGAKTNSLAKVNMKKAMIDSADRRILVADASKIEQRALLAFAPIKAFHVLITDDRIPDDFVEKCQSKGVEVVVASRR